MKWAAVTLALLALAGCDSPEKRLKAAQQRMDVMERSGASKDELCAEGDKVWQAAIDTKNQLEIQMAAVHRDNFCIGARLDRMR